MASFFKKVRKKKKGQIQQVIFLGGLILSVAICLVIAKIILTKFNSALEEGGAHTDASRDAMSKWMVVFPTLDNMMLVVMIFLTIGLLITSWMIPSHPIFIIVNILGMFFMVFIGAVLSNTYHDVITSEPDLISSAGSFPKTNFIVNKLPWILTIVIFLSTIVMYSKGRAEQQYG